jgi:uncharacterized repeat protein (TIGR01451 family)
VNKHRVFFLAVSLTLCFLVFAVFLLLSGSSIYAQTSQRPLAPIDSKNSADPDAPNQAMQYAMAEVMPTNSLRAMGRIYTAAKPSLSSIVPQHLGTRSSLCVPDDSTPPLAGMLEIRDTFGPRLLKPYGFSRYDFHRGLDWPAVIGTPVHAVTTGTVRLVQTAWPTGTVGSGNFVQLSHDDIGCETRYNHLDEVYVSEGDVVTLGQVIGTVGKTGAMYPHLHFEVRQGMTVTQRAAVHPLSTPFLSWTNTTTPTVTLVGVYTNATGLAVLVEVTSPYTEPDVVAVSLAVSGAVTDRRTVDYVALNAGTTVAAHLDSPCVNDVCMIPADLSADNDYRVMMVFDRLAHGPTATVTAQVFDVDGRSSTDTALLSKGLEVTPPEQIARGAPGQTVSLVYTLTNHTGIEDTFFLSHLSAQGWTPAAITPATATLESGESITATVEITLNTNTFGPPDCGLLKVVSQDDPQRATAGFYRIYRDAYSSAETGSDDPACGSTSAPCATIAYAISRTDEGGTIHVAQGTYTENLTLTKTVDLLASYLVIGGNVDWTKRYTKAYSTTIDGGSNGPVLVIDGDFGPRVEGFTLVNGHNSNHAGGGVRLIDGAAPTLRSNWILNNTAGKSGGGIYIGGFGSFTPTIINNTIIGNISNSPDGGGGGIYITDRPALIQGNIISGNQALHSGGGVYLTGDTTAQVLGNWIEDNEAADDGGGVLVRSSGVCLINNSIGENVASGTGNGIRVAGSSSPCIYHNTMLANHLESGAGLYIGSGSAPAVINNIFANHTIGVHCSDEIPVSYNVLSNTIDLEGCTDDGNLYADPRLADQVHLAVDSPAVDVGVDAGVHDDIDGEPRPIGAGHDIGADELRYAAFIVTKRADRDAVQAGSQLTYTLRVTNTGNVDLHTTITDVLPDHVTPGGVLTWAPIITAPGGVWTEQVTVAVTWGYSGTLTNVLQVTSDEGVMGIYTETSQALVTPSLSVTKQADPDPVQAGSQLTYTLRVSNTGNVDLHTTITDVLPDHVTPGGVFTWVPALLQPGEMWTETIVVTVEQGYSGTLDNVMEVATDEGLTDAYTRTVTVKEVLVGLSAINDSPTMLGEVTTLTATVTAGGNVSYSWAFDDGMFGSGAVATHTYPAVGFYAALVTASNSAGELTATTWVTIAEPESSIYLPLVVKSH